METRSRRSAGSSGQRSGRAPRRAPATLRAYTADLRDIAAWCHRMGVPDGLAGLSDQIVFAYIADLFRRGRSPATIRRRLTALRNSSHLPVPHNGLSTDGLFHLERRALQAADAQTTVLVVTDDAIVRAGLSAVLAGHGILNWSDTVAGADVLTAQVCDYVLIWLPSRQGLDPFASISWIRSLSMRSATRVPVVAIFPSRISRMVRLRLAEAGATYAVPQQWLSDSLHDLPHMLARAEVPTEFHLETPLAIRQELGLRLSGDLAALVAEALAVPAVVWRIDKRQDELPLRRGEIQRLRRVALERAGVPPPPFPRHASSLRSPPSTPEWVEVRRVVREAFNLLGQAQ